MKLFTAAIVIRIAAAASGISEHEDPAVAIRTLMVNQSKLMAKVDEQSAEIASLKNMFKIPTVPQGTKHVRRGLQDDVPMTSLHDIWGSYYSLLHKFDAIAEAVEAVAKCVDYDNSGTCHIGNEDVNAVKIKANVINVSSQGDTVVTSSNGDVKVIVDGSNLLQKKTICYSDTTKDFMVRAEADDTHIVIDEDFEGYFNFTTLSVGGGQDVMIDVTASTGTLMFTGNDYGASFDLAETVGGLLEYPASNTVSKIRWNSVNEASVALGIVLIPPGGGTAISPVPQSVVTLNSMEDVFALNQDDWFADDDGFFFQKNSTAAHAAQFFFPNLEAGDYDVKVNIFLDVGAELIKYDSLDEYAVVSKVVLGPHSIIATVLDSKDGECDAVTEVTRRN